MVVESSAYLSPPMRNMPRSISRTTRATTPGAGQAAGLRSAVAAVRSRGSGRRTGACAELLGVANDPPEPVVDGTGSRRLLSVPVFG